jgi:hypothetical protein
MADFQSPPKQSPLVEDTGRCTPLWLKWFIDLTQFINGFVPETRTITVTTPMTIGGGLSADLSADRTISPGGVAGVVVITTAKLTPAGANGSMTFTNGILTAHTDAT